MFKKANQTIKLLECEIVNELRKKDFLPSMMLKRRIGCQGIFETALYYIALSNLIGKNIVSWHKSLSAFGKPETIYYLEDQKK
jgi:hypothetical protein